jgi:hypothetical protein
MKPGNVDAQRRASTFRQDIQFFQFSIRQTSSEMEKRRCVYRELGSINAPV